MDEGAPLRRGLRRPGKGMCCRWARGTCRWRAVRKGTAAAEKRCGGRAAEGRIVSKQPVAVDETAVTGCAFATRQRLSGVGRSWRAGLNRCNRADTVPHRRSERKPIARRGTLPWRHRELHGLRVNSLDVGRRTPTGMRRLWVQERSDAIGCIYSMEWALADEKKKKNRGEKIRQSVGRAALREQSPCERSRVDRKERVFPRWKRRSKIEAAWEPVQGAGTKWQMLQLSCLSPGTCPGKWWCRWHGRCVRCARAGAGVPFSPACCPSRAVAAAVARRQAMHSAPCPSALRPMCSVGTALSW